MYVYEFSLLLQLSPLEKGVAVRPRRTATVETGVPRPSVVGFYSPVRTIGDVYT